MNIRKPIKKVLYTLQKNPVSKFIYENEIKYRSKLSLTDTEKLAKHINVFSPFTCEINPPNDWYGHAKVFKQFLGLPDNYQFKAVIEHGLHLIDKVVDLELEIDLPSFITYSDFRKNIITKYNKKSFCIGPYIHYARHYLTDKQLSQEKKRLGKCLLLFPSHSSGDINIDYDINTLCNKVQKIAKNYDTVRVCLYWKEVLRGHAKYYQKFGFECVTAGHILDPNFLPRLKSIIETSSLTVSNTLGNHLGYSIFMNKPHFIIQQKEIARGRKSEVTKATKFNGSKLFDIVTKPFTKFTTGITPQQKRIVNHYWGIDQIKTKKEFLKIIKETETIYQTKKS